MRLTKYLVAYSLWIIFGLSAIPVDASAYASTDTGIVTVVLPEGWKMKSKGSHKDITATNYEKTLSKTEAVNLAEIQLGKSAKKPAADIIKEMSERINDQVTVEHCEVDPLKKLTVKDNSFNIWAQIIQCKNTDSGIVQLYMDADPKTLYLFTYTKPGYPFTPKERAAVMDLLKSSIQVCYKDKVCHSFSD